MILFQFFKQTKYENLLQFAEFNTSGELVEMKTNEIEELTIYCQKCYEEQKLAFEKRKSNVQSIILKRQ